ncbi:HNH endonuclease family protein [Cryobacterium gelidum]|uniref:HNH endonuclease family protein n=1 Tax=Cryobacterium gelidum TaxID=1259164 RepID=UPI003B972996
MTVRRPTRSVLVIGVIVGVLAAILIGTAVTGTSVSPDRARTMGSATPTAARPATTAPEPAALAVLATLPIKGRAPKTGYDREESFGSAWQDVDQNGCDTRNDILARDLTVLVVDSGCEVQSGTLLGPYTGLTIAFVRGQTTSSLVQIDHVVALSNAWQTGAQQLSQQQRVALANDPLNLLAVDGVTNSRKGDGDTATWLPPLNSYRCIYVARQVSVKAAHALWVTPAEHDAMTRILSDCPDELSSTGIAPGDAPEPAEPDDETPSNVFSQPAPPHVRPARPPCTPEIPATAATSTATATAAPANRPPAGYGAPSSRGTISSISSAVKVVNTIPHSNHS